MEVLKCVAFSSYFYFQVVPLMMPSLSGLSSASA
jgi:hypothetical protein